MEPVPEIGWLQKINEAFVFVVTSPALPAFISAWLGHLLTDAIKEIANDRRQASGKPYLGGKVIQLLAVVVTQVIFVITWSAALYFKRKSVPGATWGELDFLYGIVGAAGAIGWHHIQEWRHPPKTPTPDGA